MLLSKLAPLEVIFYTMQKRLGHGKLNEKECPALHV
jgi:hypothetical protein